MPFDPPAPRLREYARALRHIWGAFQQEHPLDFRGQYYTQDYLPAAISPGPLESGPPPIHLAAVGPLMFQAAGEVADGALIHPIHTEEYLRQVAEPALRQGLEQSGRDRDAFTLSATVLCIVGDGEAEGQRGAVRRQFAFYASTPAYRPVLDLHSWGRLGDRLRDAVRRGAYESMADEVADEVPD
jgi:probable F420-dependent oxidoreductase